MRPFVVNIHPQMMMRLVQADIMMAKRKQKMKYSNQNSNKITYNNDLQWSNGELTGDTSL